MNVGANSVTDSGFFFAWGETDGYSDEEVGTVKRFTFLDGDYKYGEGTPFSKYDTDGLTELEPSDDGVQQAWGGSWVTPTKSDFDELISNTTFAWVNNYQNSGVPGATFTGNGNVLFIPAVGYAYDGTIGDNGALGIVWASSLNTEGTDYAYGFSVDEAEAGVHNYFERCSGLKLRGISK